MRPRIAFRTFFVALLLLLSGCSGGGDSTSGDATDASQEPLRIVFVTHGQASDPFWSVVQNGARQAGQDTGIDVEYQSPDSFDMVVMAQLIDAAVASGPDGLVVSLPDPDALREPLRKAMDAGIPVISINSGNDVAEELGMLAHVGQTEYEAGYGGGEQMAAAGIRKALCVNQEVGNLGLDRRCEGFADAMEEAGASVEVLAVEMGDPTESQQRMQARLTSDADIDGLLTLGPTTVQPALRALRDTDRLDEVELATFDLSPEILQAIDDGNLLFAIDQQQYMQGYLPVIMLNLYLRNANTFPDTIVRTGPAFVTEENVERLRALAQQGTR
jgi:simple sugar transport system substrate-binding protein